MTMPKVHFVKKARKDNPVCKKGQSYYWWKFRFSGKRYSLTRPKQSQLTQSEFLQTIYGIEEQIEDLTTSEDLEAQKDEIIQQIEQLKDETEEKRDNMPDQLQDGDVGQLLQDRVDALDDMICELEGIDCEPEEVNEQDVREEIEREEDETEGEYDLRIQDEVEERNDQAKQEILDQIQEVCYEGE